VTITKTNGAQNFELDAPGGVKSPSGQGVCGEAPPTQKQDAGQISHS